MCGICGMRRLGEVPIDPSGELMGLMTDAMAHRGPNDRGTWSDGEVALGVRRLSIIDLSIAGHQPMSNEDGTIWLSFNGEIYNYKELRNDLLRHGHRFRSQTDSEVLVHLYEEEGEAFLNDLNGMFAIALWDQRRQKLVLARDRFGKKPVYYYC